MLARYSGVISGVCIEPLRFLRDSVHEATSVDV